MDGILLFTPSSVECCQALARFFPVSFTKVSARGNPNCIGQGQNWPFQLWYQILEKLLCKNIYLWENVLQILFYLIHNVKKWCFYVHNNDITSKVWPWCYLTALPPSTQLYCYFRPPEGKEKKPQGLWSAVWQRRWGFQSVSGPLPYILNTE